MITDPFARLAVDLEVRAGLPCGGCGLPHMTDGHDGNRPTCLCCGPCVQQACQMLARQFPDVVGSASVLTASMMEEIARRLEAELAELREQDADWKREHQVGGP